jgi:hypothetical protein
MTSSAGRIAETAVFQRENALRAGPEKTTAPNEKCPFPLGNAFLSQ